MSRRIEISHESPSCALVSGHGSRDLVMKVTTRSPVWATLSRGWVIQPSRVPDLVAIAEARGYEVVETNIGDDPARGRW